ncbi:MAG: hypothetical protein Q6362_002395 [Candidatus Wukongarchaeota archaeon]|nr:hypothetical protein [Candidatus Wukongarchaeota archaeon]
MAVKSEEEEKEVSEVSEEAEGIVEEEKEIEAEVLVEEEKKPSSFSFFKQLFEPSMLYNFLALLGFLVVLLVLTVLDLEREVVWLASGLLIAYLIMFILATPEKTRKFTQHPKIGPGLSITFTIIFTVIFAYYFRDSQTVLLIPLFSIWILWTLAQAYFISLPVSSFSNKLASKFEKPRESEGERSEEEAEESGSKIGLFHILIAFAVVISASVAYIVTRFTINWQFDGENRWQMYTWFILNTVLIILTIIVILKHVGAGTAYKDLAVFTFTFFVVFWLYMLYQSWSVVVTFLKESRNEVLDVMLMLSVVLIASYSFACRAIKIEKRFINPVNVIFLTFGFAVAYVGFELYWTMKDWGDPRIIAMVTHMIIFLFAIPVLLATPLMYGSSRGYLVPEGFLKKTMIIMGGKT